jgi:hypothetical protein
VLLLPFFFLRLSENALRAELVPTARGGVAFVGIETGTPELLSRIAATPPEDACFFCPFIPLLPFLTAREQVSRYDLFLPGHTLAFQYQDACISVMRNASWVAIGRIAADPKVLSKVYPAMGDAELQQAKRFEKSLG